MKKRRASRFNTDGKNIIIFGVLLSFAVLMLTLLAASAVLSLITLKAPTRNVNTALLAALVISAAISGFTVARRKGEGGTAASVFSSLIFSVLMLAVALISTKGNVGGSVFMNCLCYTLTAVFGAFAAKKRAHRRRRHK